MERSPCITGVRTNSSPMRGIERYRFVCSDCDASMLVDGEMRAVISEQGCVVCGAAATDDAFTEC